MQTVTRRRIEVLADRPLMRRVAAAAAEAGIEHYTLLPTDAGVGHTGSWSEDELTGALAKQVFMAVCGEDAAARFVDAIAPLLDSHGLMLMLFDVEVVRGAHF
jgi:hypothetical protein